MQQQMVDTSLTRGICSSAPSSLSIFQRVRPPARKLRTGFRFGFLCRNPASSWHQTRPDLAVRSPPYHDHEMCDGWHRSLPGHGDHSRTMIDGSLQSWWPASYRALSDELRVCSSMIGMAQRFHRLDGGCAAGQDLRCRTQVSIVEPPLDQSHRAHPTLGDGTESGRQPDCQMILGQVESKM